MPSKAEKLRYITSLAKELVEISDEIGRPTLSFLLRMAILEAKSKVADAPRPGGNDGEIIASLVKELAEMSDGLGRPTLSYLLRMAKLEAEGGAEAPRPGRTG
ncbi:hypothetical protein [Bradyrhizobium sp.]